MKYKVGDKVKIRKDLKIGEIYGGCLCTGGMQDLAGKVVRITEVHKNYRKYRYRVASSNWYWADEMFEENKKKMNDNDSIRILVSGNQVIAIHMETGKKGIARCHPDDTFDFYTGAKIALERLEEAEKPYAWLELEASYYVPKPTLSNLYSTVTYTADDYDKRVMKRGIVFKTPGEAIECARKMLATVKKES